MRSIIFWGNAEIPFDIGGDLNVCSSYYSSIKQNEGHRSYVIFLRILAKLGRKKNVCNKGIKKQTRFVLPQPMTIVGGRGVGLLLMTARNRNAATTSSKRWRGSPSEKSCSWSIVVITCFCCSLQWKKTNHQFFQENTLGSKGQGQR